MEVLGLNTWLAAQQRTTTRVACDTYDLVSTGQDLRGVAGMRAERQQPLDARPVAHLLSPEVVVFGPQLQQALALRKQVRVRVAHRLHGILDAEPRKVTSRSLTMSLPGCAACSAKRLSCRSINMRTLTLTRLLHLHRVLRHIP